MQLFLIYTCGTVHGWPVVQSLGDGGGGGIYYK